VLGAIKLKADWRWTAIGKHPAARDYIRLGDDAPLADAFAGWIENGYRRFVKQQPDPSGLHSWRFWAKGMRKSHIACGLAKDSSDTLGRSYPLILMGVGKIVGWEKHWDQLPTVLEDVWGQMEYLTAKRFRDLQQMESALVRLTVPCAAWLEAPLDRGETLAENPKGHDASVTRDIAQAAATLRGQQAVQMTLGHHNGNLAMARVSTWNQILRRHVDEVPHTLFIGGKPEVSYVVVYNRSLRAQDFIRMWSL
jgi:type VI secretion system protein VasJ